MTPAERGLGRGLNAIIPADGKVSAGSFREVAVSSIVPNTLQPRTSFDEDSLEELVASISQVGVLQPILVRQLDSQKFEIIAGERRWRAAKRAGLISIPVLVRDAGEQRALEEALVENLQRDDLNPVEEALAFDRLSEFGLTQQELAKRVGRSRPAVANSLRLLQLSPSVQNLLINRELSAGHGRILLAVKNPNTQATLAERAAEENWSVRQLEDYVRNKLQKENKQNKDRKKNSAPVSKPNPVRGAAIIELEELLSEYLSTSVSVSIGDGKGRLTVDFADIDDLERVFRLIIP